MNLRRTALTAALLSLGCRPPEAPEDLDLLSSYLFSHVWDDDSTNVEVGLDNLRVWLEKNLEETEDGFEVQVLDQEQVNKLDNCKRDVSGLVGAAVATRRDYTVEEMVQSNITVPAGDIWDDVISSRRLDFTPERDCYLDGDCERIQFRTLTEARYAGIMTARSKNGIQYRWVDTEHGTAVVYRTWLQKPAVLSMDGVHIDTSFYLSAAMPWDNGTIRLQALWAATELESLPVPASFALATAIKTMRNNDSDLADYIAGD